MKSTRAMDSKNGNGIMASGKKVEYLQIVVKNEIINSVRHTVLATIYRVINSVPTLFPRYLCLRTGMTTSRKHGFTLIELSIVLVIIGLLVGGVMAAKDLMKAGEIRSQISQIEQLKTALNTFKVKYGYLPADIPPSQTAQLGFFTFTGTLSGKTYSASPYPLLCGYGDNDGRISWGEQYVFWQHLSESGFIKGNYGGKIGSSHLEANATGFDATNATGTWCNGGNPLDLSNSPLKPVPVDQLGIFAPNSELRGGNNLGYIYVSPVIASTWLFPSANNTTLNNLFNVNTTRIEMNSIDTKIDDGLPLTGSVREYWSDYYQGVYMAPQPPNPNCTKGSGSNITYDLDIATLDAYNSCKASFLW